MRVGMCDGVRVGKHEVYISQSPRVTVHIGWYMFIGDWKVGERLTSSAFVNDVQLEAACY